jgi:hypothetical protein
MRQAKAPGEEFLGALDEDCIGREDFGIDFRLFLRIRLAPSFLGLGSDGRIFRGLPSNNSLFLSGLLLPPSSKMHSGRLKSCSRSPRK